MAVNLALGVQYAAGVIPAHRNLVTLKPKATTMASYAANNPNPASNYGALQVPTTTHRNLVTRRGKRIGVAVANPELGVAANPEDGAAASPEVTRNATTTITFENGIPGSPCHCIHHIFWAGNDDKNIPDVEYKKPAVYKHIGDDEAGSMGGFVYRLTESLYWVVAWRNTSKDSYKVYTSILSRDPSDVDKFWNEIRADELQWRDISYYSDAVYEARIHVTPGNPLKLTASFRYKK